MQKLKVQGETRLPTIWRKPSLVFGGLGLAALVAVEFTGQNDWFVLGWVCALTLIYAMMVLYQGFRDGAARVLTDPFVILVGAFSLYFLFGALLLVVGPEDQASYALQWYPTTARDAVRVTAMNLIGLATVLFAAGIFPSQRVEKSVQPAIALFDKFSIKKIFWWFLIIGVGAKLQVLSVDISVTEGVVVLGTIRTLTNLTELAILVGILYQGRDAGAIHVVTIALTIFDLVLGLLFFNKTTVLMPVMALFFGLYLRLPSLKLVVASVATLATLLLFLANPIGEARDLFGEIPDKSLSMRFQILKEVFGSDAAAPDYGSGSWARICYIVQQVAAVSLYEGGQGGNDVELLGWVFVPRVLFPNKPIITRSSTDFNKKVTGYDTSSNAPGLFVSGYYNLGWVGLFLASLLAGWILATFAAISRAVVASGSIIWLPLGLLGAYMAFRVDGHFVVDYLGPFGMLMVPFLALRTIARTGSRKAIAERVL
jgi:hypothetical protein